MLQSYRLCSYVIQTTYILYTFLYELRLATIFTKYLNALD